MNKPKEGGRFSFLDFFTSLERFKPHDVSGKPLGSDCRSAYWYGENYANFLLAKSYLDALGFQWIALWDMAQANDAGDLMGWVLLTDYNVDYYKH